MEQSLLRRQKIYKKENVGKILLKIERHMHVVFAIFKILFLVCLSNKNLKLFIPTGSFEVYFLRDRVFQKFWTSVEPK